MWNNNRKRKGTRFLSGILAVALTLTIISEWAVPVARAADWMTPNLNKLVSWGVMRGDENGSLNENKEITRAEYVSMINRAYGYKDDGKIPFSDVNIKDWYSDDIATAYNTGYFYGTTDTTAAPNSTLTREQAVTILGRNLMLDKTNGEVTEFSDGRDISDWSRGIIRTAKKQGIVNGYPDGTFHPKKNITRGEAATLLANAIGTPVNTAGNYTLGGIYGNVTITTSGITLRDTTIAGNLYITGGLDTGYITLENVTVLGDIIVSGSGESNKGDNSIILRNVTSDKMQVDSLVNQYISIQADGDTDIGTVSVRTPAYLEDRTVSGMGFKYIELDGEEGTTLSLSGNIDEVINKTPKSTLQMAQGQAAIITVDEAATDSSMIVGSGAVVKELNLDIATPITGSGDIDNLNVNAAGCTSTVLPDNINIRPGLTAVIAGEKMNVTTAEESSEDPRLLSGYPAAQDVSPTGFNAEFSTNKSGTIYWGITPTPNGSLNETQLESPTAVTSIVKSGNVVVKTSNTETTVKVSGLQLDTSYYLSAVLVDNRGQVSPVKVAAFTTPDNSVPAFASGYPYMSKITNISGQVTVMPTKTCKLYYALLLKGSTAPTAKDFSKGSISGNYGYGILDVTKNTTRTFTVNNKTLLELESYDLYLWLNDADGGKSSAVKKVSFTTVDKTPPVFNTEPTVSSVKANAIGLTFNLNEAGTVYWVAVKAGAEYPKPLAGHTGKVELDSDSAKLQVAAGMNGIKSGSISATANKDGTINISGLEVQTSYDIYYVAKDKAGNYSETVKVVTANTEDTIAPTATQEFTRYNGTDTTKPLANTDIRIVFSEGVQEAESPTNQSLVSLYNDVVNASADSDKATARAALASALRNTIQLYTINTNGSTSQVAERTGSETNWVIDYRYATVKMEDGKAVITFPTTSDLSTSALNLKSGSSYYFQLQGIADTSTAKNRMGTTKLDTFTTVFAQVDLSTTSQTSLTLASDSSTVDDIDMSFQMAPESTSKVEDSISWDMLIWCDTSVDFELYRRVKNTDGTVSSGWEQLGGTQSLTNTNSSEYVGLSLTRDFLTSGSAQPSFEQLNKLKEDQIYEYAIRFTKVDGESDRTVWSQRINCKVDVVAGGSNVLSNLSVSVTSDDWTEAQEDGATSIGLPTTFILKKQFTDKRAPVFAGESPVIDAADTYANMTLLLDRSGTIYYVVSKKGLIITQDDNGNEIIDSQIPLGGTDTIDPPALSLPSYLNIVNPKYSNTQIKTGSVTGDTGATQLKVAGLEPNTEYYVYFVLKGTGQVFSDVLCYRFTTTEADRPKITLDLQNPSVNVSTSEDAEVNYALLVDGKCPDVFYKPFKNYVADVSTLPASYNDNDYTVLDAMIGSVIENKELKGSVFDIYAAQTWKEYFATLIRNQKADDGGTVVLVGSVTVSKNSVETVKCKDYMSGSTWYCFLSVGRNVQGTSDAFRAIRPVYQVDTQAPMVVSCSTSIDFTSNPPATSLSAATSRAYSGSLSIMFSEQLYNVSISDNTQVIKPIEATTLGNTTSGYVSLGTVLSLPVSATVNYSNPVYGPCSEVRFTFTNLRYGESISLKKTVCDAYGNVHSSPLVLTLNVSQADAQGNYIPYFTITKDWDATS